MTPDELAKRGVDPVWPIGFYAPGSYTCTCVLCGKHHIADKRAVNCADCTLQACYREIERLRADYFAAEARGMERAAEMFDGLEVLRKVWTARGVADAIRAALTGSQP